MLYDDFVKDYNNMNLTTHEVRRINNLNSKQYTNLRNRAIRNGDIPEVRHMNQITARFYSRREDGTFDVQKTINGEKIYVGRFSDEVTAKKVVKKCINHNWRVNEIKDFINLNKVYPKNYGLVNGYYIIQKTVNGRNKVFAIIHKDKVSEDVVKEIVNMFRNVSWNINYKDRILGSFNI